jgi:hypothetical protein
MRWCFPAAARAPAYQVGVLRAVSELLPDPQRQSLPDPVRHLGRLAQLGRAGLPGRGLRPARGQAGPGVGNFHAGQVYRADALGICMSGARWLAR